MADRVPDVTEHVYAIRRALGKDPKRVISVIINPHNVIITEVLDDGGLNADTIGAISQHRWR